MSTFTRFLVLSLSLLSHICANAASTSDGVIWLQEGRSVLVQLATPDLYTWNPCDQIATHCPGSFIFNFTLTPDNLTLLLNDEPILPRTNPYVPTRLRAHQVANTAEGYTRGRVTNFSRAPVMDLDYYIETTPPAIWETSIYNTRYNPRVRFDILRAHMPTYPGYISTSFSSEAQKQIWVYLEDLAAHPPGTPRSRIPLRIKDVNVDRRWHWGTPTYMPRKSLKTCHIWSWLCADTDVYPFYEYIYQEDFDQYGKKGSLRQFTLMRWDDLVGLIGIRQAVALLAIVVSMLLSPPVYAVTWGVRSVIEVYRKRAQEVQDWLADEEVDGILENDRYFEDHKVIKKQDESKREEGERTSLKERLPPPSPSTTSTTTEKSSAS